MISPRDTAHIGWIFIFYLLFFNGVQANDTKNVYQVTDFSEQTIKLDNPAKRIVALAPHIVENIFSAGAGDTVVGVVSYSNFPEAANNISLVGSFEKINYEKILELKPDLIIAWESGNSVSAIQKLRGLGFPVYIDQPDNLEDVAKSILDIGTLTNNLETAVQVSNSYLEEVARQRDKYLNKPRLKVFYQVWNKPLQTINGTHIISSAIELCGGDNIYANEIVTAPVINIESILSKDPDVIIASGMSNERPPWLNEWKQWQTLSAVKNQHLFYINPDHIQRHTIRLLLGINAICSQLESTRNDLFER